MYPSNQYLYWKASGSFGIEKTGLASGSEGKEMFHFPLPLITDSRKPSLQLARYCFVRLLLRDRTLSRNLIESVHKREQRINIIDKILN